MKTRPAALLLAPALLTISPWGTARAAVVQTNSGTGTVSPGWPGDPFNPAGNLLATNLERASRLDGSSFYNEFRDPNPYPVELERLYDGELGTLGSSGLGFTGDYTVMPNVATLQFDFDAAFDLTAIRTYASWDSGRSGQGYEVKYSTDGVTFVTLHSVANWNNDLTDETIFTSWWDNYGEGDVQEFDRSVSTTLVTLTSDSGALAEDVVALQFVFSGYQNGGTAFREFQVEGSAVSAVPEPSALLATAGLLGGGLLLRRRGRRSVG